MADNKYVPITSTFSILFSSSDSEDDDDDFIEVEEKPGFEETVPAEDHVLGIPFFYDGPSTSKGDYKVRTSHALRQKNGKPSPILPHFLTAK